MVWLRYVRIRVIWRCNTTRGYSTRYHAVGVAIKDEYEKKPTENIDEWAKRLGDIVAKKMCENSCQSLSTSVFCDTASIEVEIIYTSETLVVKPPEVKKPEIMEKEETKELKEKLEEKVEVVPIPIVPKYIFEQIAYLEEKYKEAENIDEKMAIKEEIDKIKQRYGIT